MKVHQQGTATVFEGVQSDAHFGDVNYVRVRRAVKGVKTLSGAGAGLPRYAVAAA